MGEAWGAGGGRQEEKTAEAEITAVDTGRLSCNSLHFLLEAQPRYHILADSCSVTYTASAL